MMPRTTLGGSGLDVSRFALGSWRTFERIGRDEGVAVMLAAREAGITFLDDARYDDETGTAPIPTGYSEVLFGELFRAAGWPRDETVVTNKLWWEFWPEETAAGELDGSLLRMGFEHIDVIYANPPPAGLSLDELVASVGGLIAAGKARAWAVVNWPAELIARASAVARSTGVPQPCAAQLPYSLARRSPVEDDDMRAALAGCGAPVVASFVLAGGVLTGKYAHGPAAGRAAGTLDDPKVVPAVHAAVQLVALAANAGTTPAALAVAFTLTNPDVGSVLFGATSPAQLAENVSAPAVLERLSDDQLLALGRIGLGAG
jgi:aryl-alcohol dehydrogenase-like predicted oxidoreductase